MQNKKIISDVIITRPKEKLAKEMFREPEPTFKPGKNFRPRFNKISRLVSFLFFLITMSWLIFSWLSSRVEIILTPKSVSIDFNKTILLVRATSAPVNANENILGFSTVALAYPTSGLFVPSGKKTLENKAEGIVVIFNKSSKSPQVLVASTRLESPTGKIYHIPLTVIIPGYKMEGSKIMPGSKEVRVYADKAGAEYNMGLTDFTIPGFKGSPKFETVFARSKTEITGGVVGNINLITKTAADEAVTSLVSEANKNLREIILKKLPDGSILLPGSEEYTILRTNVNPKIGTPLADGAKFEIKLDAEARGAILAEKDFVGVLLKNSTESANLGLLGAHIKDIKKLSLKISGYKFDAANFKLDIKGKTEIEATLNKEAIKNKIVESGAVNASSILSILPEAFRSEIKFSPFWSRYLPKTLLNPAYRADRIDIQIISR